MNWIQSHLVSLAIGAIPVGLIVALLYQGIKKISFTVDSLPPWLHRAAVALIAMILVALGRYLGVPIVCPEDGSNCLTTLDRPTLTLIVEGGLATLAALLTHKAKKIVKG